MLYNNVYFVCFRDCTQTNNDSNFMNVDEGSIYTSCIQNPDANSDDDDGQILYAKLEKEIDLRTEIHNWALKHNVTHVALKDLLQILNKTTPNLPTDPRTLLGTPRAITTTLVESGEYWHNGLKKCIVKILDSKATDIPQGISITINIDGLPIHNSSKQQFWPILCSIFERPELQPTVCGIYVGESKPKDLKAYLSPFVDELDDLLQNGVEIQNKIVQVNLRCFVCDSPARAMIKGIYKNIFKNKNSDDFEKLDDREQAKVFFMK